MIQIHGLEQEWSRNPCVQTNVTENIQLGKLSSI
jgi:hypothetical protein